MKRFFLVLLLLLFFTISIYAQNTEASRRDTILYGTETEIAALIQTLRSENADYLDDELIVLVETTRNQRILTGVFGFFADREKIGLEERAIRAIVERDAESNETVHSAMDYLGKIKSADAVPIIIEILDTEERRFLNTGFRALGRAASQAGVLADEAADFLIDFYENRNPGQDNQRDIIISIGAAKSVNGVSFLADIASNTDERIALRVAALEALAGIGDPGGLDVILECVNTNDPNVRAAAVAALGPFSGEAVDSAILEGFRDSYYRTRIAAAQAAHDRRLESAVPFLQFRAERDEVANVKDEAIRALGAIANSEAVTVLENLFTEKRNSDRVRLLAAEMLMKHNADDYLGQVISELEEARIRNYTGLLNGFLRITGEAVVSGDKTEIRDLARRFMQTGSVIEKLYGLDMAANNSLTELDAEIIILARDRNQSISGRAARTAERLGIEIPDA